MTSNDMIGFLITGGVSLLLIVIGIFLLRGKGAFLIAGYNTMSKAEQAQYDAPKLCRFIGKILLPMALLTPLPMVGAYFRLNWPAYAYLAIMGALLVFTLIYANTGNQFKK